jgi:hypothetical protein
VTPRTALHAGQLSSRRFFCSEGENTEIVAEASRAELSRVLDVLDLAEPA